MTQKAKDKILITGISGFIGQELSKRLLKEGYEVHGLYESNGSMQKNDPEVKKHHGNLIEFQHMEMLIDNIKPDYVIHLAAKTEVALSFDNYLNVSLVNYIGTVNLLEANRKLNPNLKLFIHASTMETYGFHKKEDGPFDEDTKQRPRAPYAVAKLACEAYLRYMFFAYKFPFTAFRQTNAYGRHDNDFFVMERIISQMVENKQECNLGDPDPYRNFLYIDDLIELYMAALKNPDKVVGEFFVTGPDNVIKIEDLANKIKKRLGWEGKINWHTQPKRPGEIYYLNSNPKKAKKVLGWEPKVSLDEGIDKTIEIWRSNYARQTSQVRSKQSQGTSV